MRLLLLLLAWLGGLLVLPADVAELHLVVVPVVLGVASCTLTREHTDDR